MNSRLLLICILSAVCLAMLTSALIQRRQITGLRAEEEGLVRQLGPAQDTLSPAGNTIPSALASKSVTTPSLELLKLRSEVGRLMERRRELAPARGENERLRVQLAASRKNGPVANALPPDYVRKSDARFVGYNTPADTIQSLLWAIQHRDFTNMAEAFTPETARQMRQDVQRSGTEEFFKDVSIIPGMHIKNQQQMPDGSIELEVEMVPGEPLPERMRFRLINGQWKLETL